MRAFKLIWEIHKWIGVVLGVFLTVISVTGLLLLLKKHVDWIQPPTQKDKAGVVADYIPLDRVYEIAFNSGHPQFESEADIDRIDFRPSKRIYKVRSKHDNFELQIGAVSGTIHSAKGRWSDWIEQLHDGQVIAAWFHTYWMPAVAVGLTLLSITGFWIFLYPHWRRWRKRVRASS